MEAKNVTREPKTMFSILCISQRSQDQEPSVLLKVGSSTFIVEAPESTSRGFKCSKVSTKTLKGVFTTSLYPYSAGLYFFFDVLRLQTSANLRVLGPKDIVKLPMLKNPQYEDYSCFLTTEYSNDSFEVKKIELTNTVAFSISVHLTEKQMIHEPLKDIMHEQRVLFLELTDEKDYELLFDINDYDAIFHFSDPSVVKSQKYVDFFSRAKLNVCFMNTQQSIFKSAEIYNKSCTTSKFPLCAVEKSEEAPPGFINFVCESEVHFDLINEAKVINKDIQSVPEIKGTLPPVNSITVLGSNCSTPLLYRTVSSHLLATKYGYILFDCGGNTLGQIYRKYGYEKGKEILKNMICIWCSHGHPDHVSGIIKILIERRKAGFTEKLPTFIPKNAQDYVRGFEEIFGSFNIDVCPYSMDGVKLEGYNNITLRSAPVKHCNESYACKCTFDKFSFIFSGDRNVSVPIDYLKPCDILLHESTYLDDEYHANKYNHSTQPQAVLESKKLKAKYAIFTHFSLHYPRFKEVSENNIAFAIDFLTVPFGVSKKEFEIIRESALKCWETDDSVIEKKPSKKWSFFSKK